MKHNKRKTARGLYVTALLLTVILAGLESTI